MTPKLLIGGLIITAAACASPQWTAPPNTTKEQMDHDWYDCEFAARHNGNYRYTNNPPSGQIYMVPSGQSSDQATFTRCFEARGYTWGEAASSR